MKKAGKYWVPDCETQQLEALEEGGWQTDRLLRALSLVTNFGTAIDGGAHVGTWTEIMADRFDGVHAFEPSEETFDCLRANVGERQNVHLHRLALGDKPGKGTLYEDEKYEGGNTGGRYVREGSDFSITTIDQMRLPNVGFVKLDLEGFEPFALEGGKKTLLRWKPVVMVEDKSRMAGRYGLKPHAAPVWLVEHGATELLRIGDDRVFGWQ